MLPETVEKKVLSLEELEAQIALELPDRELMQQNGLVNISLLNGANVGACVVCNVGIGVAATVCGVNANVLANQLGPGQPVNCTALTNATNGAFNFVVTRG